VAGSEAGSTFSGNITVSSSGCYDITATATNTCGATATDGPKQINVYSCYAPFRKGDIIATWSSDLTIDGGRLQIVVNGAGGATADKGRTYGSARVREGENRVEATVVQGGRAGLWRIDFRPDAMVAGSIRVIAGQTVEVGATMVTFRLSGAPGERIAFTFHRK
jgi:hypothetical protein